MRRLILAALAATAFAGHARADMVDPIPCATVNASQMPDSPRYVTGVIDGWFAGMGHAAGMTPAQVMKRGAEAIRICSRASYLTLPEAWAIAKAMVAVGPN
jgi:hypothetical protein